VLAWLSLVKFQFPIRNSVRSDCWPCRQFAGSRCCFNSPFGILFVRTRDDVAKLISVFRQFQFPIRNSVRSDMPRLPCTTITVSVFQFPIRNSVRSDPSRRSRSRPPPACFNSPFGILFVRTPLPQPRRPSLCAGFNSPFGILFVRTFGGARVRDYSIGVSIPHSEFCSFGPGKWSFRVRSWGVFQFPIRNSVRSDKQSLIGV